MPDLNSQDIELRMILNYSQHDRADGRGCQVEPFLYPNEHLRRRMHGYEDGDNPEEWLRTRLQQMFGDPEFSAGNIIAKYLKRLHLRHYERPNWIFLEPPGDDIKTWVVKAPLTHLVLDNSWLTGTMIFFGGGDPLPEDGLKLHFPKLTHLRLVASNVSERVPRWMEYHARTMKLRRVQFVESRALPAVWSEIKDTYERVCEYQEKLAIDRWILEMRDVRIEKVEDRKLEYESGYDPRSGYSYSWDGVA
jgi:hypothetical protein